MSRRGKEQEDVSPASIDVAIGDCIDSIKGHREAATFILVLTSAITVVLVGSVVAGVSNRIVPESLAYMATPIIAVVVLLGFSFYKFHWNEVAKLEHFKLGFMRIRIAANNIELRGFRGDVRRALTRNAFSYRTPPPLFKRKYIENPIPGHPTSEISTAVIDKILELAFDNRKPQTRATQR